MRLGQKIGLISVFVIAAIGFYGFLLFDGDLDFDGHYEILQAIPYSRTKIAFEIERMDHQAMNGPRYAVVVDDHTPTTVELRRAIISFWRHRSFELANPGVSIIWAGPNLLTLTTNVPETRPDWVMNQSHRLGSVVVKYTGQP
jgi:hypothetical protein